MLVSDPGLGGGVAFVVEAPRGSPQVFEDVDEVDDDGNVDVSLSGFGGDAVDLVVVAVDQRDPAALVAGVASGGFVEHVANDDRSVVDHAGRHPLGPRSGRGRSRPAVVAGEHVLGAAGHRGEVVDRAHLGQAFAVAFLAFGQSVGELGCGRGRGFGGGRTQLVGTHHDPFAINRDHQHVAAPGWLRSRRDVEGVDIDRGPPGEFLHLAFADALTGGPFDGVGRGVERPAGRLDRRSAAQTMGMTLPGQVQHRVGGIQVRVTPMTVRETLHIEIPEDRGHAAMVTTLDGAMSHPISVEHHSDTFFPDGANLQVFLKQLAQQLPTPPVELVFHLAMGEHPRVPTVKPTDDRLETPTRPTEPLDRRHDVHRPLPDPARRPRNTATPSSAACSNSARACS